MTIWRFLALLVPFWLIASVAGAQTHTLMEPVKPRDCFHYEIGMTLKGELRINKDGKTAAIPLAAKAEHLFTERVLDVKENGLPSKVVRNYELARSNIAVDGQATLHELSSG